jgi:heat-inducible transcriptional repressor
MYSLSDRQQYILWATVRHYISTAEPVGSKALAEEYNLNVSPATIRNAMGALEKVGLLYQPHTSAGRIPSDSGYRIYVDQLIQPAEELGKQVEQLFNHKLNWETGNFESLLQGAAQILATLSGCIALITLPQNRTNFLRHIQLLQVASDRIMVIVVMDNYTTQSVLINLPPTSEENQPNPEIIAQELQILSNFLTEELRGKSLLELTHLDWTQLGEQFQKYAEYLRAVLSDLMRPTPLHSNTQIMMRGIAEVLRQPEFSAVQQVQMLIQLLEEQQEQLLPLIFDNLDSSFLGISSKKTRANIRIGAENPLEPMRSCTLISAVYKQGAIPVGSVGVIGPTRMVYENAIAVVEAAADYLSEAIS